MSLPDCEGMTSYSLMMLGCSIFLRVDISLKVLCASVQCWKASNTFLRAYISCGFSCKLTFQTCPYAPDPNFLITLYLSSTCCSIFSLSPIDRYY